MSRSRTALVALALVALPLTALTACSSSSNSSSSSGSKSSSSGSSSSGSTTNVARPKDMCALLSTSEASTAFATKISSTYDPEKTGCNYDGEDLHFETQLSPTEVNWKLENQLLAADTGKLAPISGIGDQAEGNAKGIAFRLGSVILDIEVQPGTTSTTQAQMVAAAKVMISHLS